VLCFFRLKYLSLSPSINMGSTHQGTLRAYLQRLCNSPFQLIYILIQYFLDLVLSPTPPPPNTILVRPKIAIIGAGLTGVSSASHCVGHGFDVQIFEAGSRDSVGGIWAKVNNTCRMLIGSMST
jgi:hypothetical protein